MHHKQPSDGKSENEANSSPLVLHDFETPQQWMENQDCEEASVYPCCSQSTFPYKQDVFELCIKRAIMELDRSTSYHLVSKTPGPRFDINDTIRAIVLEFQSTYLFTLAYEKMYQFYREVKASGWRTPFIY